MPLFLLITHAYHTFQPQRAVTTEHSSCQQELLLQLEQLGCTHAL